MDELVISKAERTRRMIIEKAAPIFNKNGYAGTSCSDVMRATGLSKGAIYGNFENKDELAIAAFEYNLERTRKPLREAIDAFDNNVDKLKAYVSFYRKKFVTTMGTDGGCPVLNASVEADDGVPLLRKHVQQAVRDRIGRLAGIIDNGIERKEINPGVDATKYAIQIISIFEGGIMLAKIMNNASMLHTALDRVDEMIKNELAA